MDDLLTFYYSQQFCDVDITIPILQMRKFVRGHIMQLKYRGQVFWPLKTM